MIFIILYFLIGLGLMLWALWMARKNGFRDKLDYKKAAFFLLIWPFVVVSHFIK